MAAPGGSGKFVPQEPFAAGNYVLLCTFPDAQGNAHVNLGMHKEFTVPE
jgi:hypothetical protein